MPSRDPSTRRGPVTWLFIPVFASFLRERKLCLALGAVAVLLVAARSVGVSLWLCPFDRVFGFECAGCGMTRAAGRLAQGDLAGALSLNLLSPLVALLALVAGTITLLPAGARARAIGRVEAVERRSGAGMIFFVAVLGYVLTRNAFSL